MTTCVHVVDIKSMRTHEIASPKYWETMFTPICSRERLTPFIVLNIEDIDFDVETSRAAARNKFRMVQVELARESEFGSTNQTYIVHTHLGEFLNFNDTVLCYDLEQMTLQELEDYDNCHKYKLPDVVIVKKSYPKTRRRQQKRIWKIKRMEMEKAGEDNFWSDKKSKKQKLAAEGGADRDYKEFLDDIEEDPEMRQNIMLFKVNNCAFLTVFIGRGSD